MYYQTHHYLWLHVVYRRVNYLSRAKLVALTIDRYLDSKQHCLKCCWMYTDSNLELRWNTRVIQYAKQVYQLVTWVSGTTAYRSLKILPNIRKNGIVTEYQLMQLHQHYGEQESISLGIPKSIGQSTV